MIKTLKILLVSILLISCVQNQRDLSQNVVVAHMLSQPDGLHPFNNNSVMRSEIFTYTQKLLLQLDIKSLEYIPVLLKELPIASEDNKTFYFGTYRFKRFTTITKIVHKVLKSLIS